MKRVFLIGIVLMIATMGSVGGYLLWRKNQPQKIVIGTETVEAVKPIVIPFSSVVHPASQNPISPVWDQATKMIVPLTAQVLFIPWGTGSTSQVEVRAIHNEKTIAFRLAWEDKTRNNTLLRMSDYSDGAAIMFPLEPGVPGSLMMGFLKPTNIWHWKSVRRHEEWAKVYAEFYVKAEEGTLLATHRSTFDHPPTGSEVTDNAATMPGTLTPKNVQAVKGRGEWRNGQWYVTYSRKLQTSEREEDIQFAVNREFWAAFGVWDGNRKERGSRKSISDWVPFVLEGPRAQHD